MLRFKEPYQGPHPPRPPRSRHKEVARAIPLPEGTSGTAHRHHSGWPVEGGVSSSARKVYTRV
ncbi:hypothetical protein BHM03_00053968, partial [Ensete ventricosum]